MENIKLGVIIDGVTHELVKVRHSKNNCKHCSIYEHCINNFQSIDNNMCDILDGSIPRSYQRRYRFKQITAIK